MQADPTLADHPPPDRPDIIARQRWMAVLARAGAAAIESLMATLPAPPGHRRLRGPETGLVMVRGRAGGDGAPFNLGEMTVTRCTVRVEDGVIGHANVAGRDHRQAELAALLDALLHDATWHDAVQAAVIAPLAAEQAARQEAIARRAAATRVEFFTMTQMR
jgi:alpha-D-ribose 1-methylphosphonate 5-triphosphate synthase subunit PhnG